MDQEVKVIRARGINKFKKRRKLLLTPHHVKKEEFDQEIDIKVPAGHMVVGVHIPHRFDIMSEHINPVSGLVIMELPKDLTKEQVFDFKERPKGYQYYGGSEGDDDEPDEW